MAAPHQYRLRTAADLSLEPDDGLRRELYDGVVLVVPPPGHGHSRAVLAVYRSLFATAPGDVEVLHDVGVHTGVRRLFVPDLVVVAGGTPFHDNGFDPGGVLLVVEAVSPGSVTADRVTKPALYAEQGIPWFWRIEGIDEGAPRLQSLRLDPTTGTYECEAELGPRESGEVAGPWQVSIAMAQLG